MAKIHLNFNTDKLASLEKWQKFKNYNELCEYIEAPIVNGSSKKAQFKEWSRYVKLRINRNASITVVETYEKRLEKVDNRRNGNNTVYMSLVKLILLDYLQCNMDKELEYICLTKGGLYELLGFCNDEYLAEFVRRYKVDTEHRDKVKQLKEEYNITQFDMNNFYEHSRLKFDSVINRAIKDLVDSYVLFVTPAFMITEYEYTEYNTKLKADIIERLNTEDVTEVQLHNMLNKFECTTSRVATESEINHILNITRMSLSNFKVEFMFEAYRKGESANLFKEITLRLLEEMDWIFCYKVVKFQFTEKTLESGIYWSELNVEKYKRNTNKLNLLIKDAVNQSAVSAYNNNLKKQEQIESDALNNILTDDKVFRFKDNYIEVRQALVEYFMSLEKDEKSKN